MLQILFLSSALAYAPVNDIIFDQTVQTSSIKIGNEDFIKYSFYRSKDTVYPNNLVSNGIRLSSVASISKIREISKNITACRKNERLEIFEISSDELNYGNRIPQGFVSGGNLLGYFDSRDSEVGLNSIVLTKNSKFINFQVLTHEVAHHWYSSYCLERYTKVTSEEFAQEIQFSLKEFNNYD